MPPKKDEGGNKKATEGIIALLIGLLILAALLNGLANYISSLGYGSTTSIWGRITAYFLDHVWPIWKLVAFTFSSVLLVGIIRNVWKLRTINIEENKIYNPKPAKITAPPEEVRVPERPVNEKWKKVLEYMNSDNQSDWRLAIIEADVMLEETLHNVGYVGESLGDMLKSANKNEFITLDDAWEAHKFRNVIAHAGSNFQMTERDTKRIIDLFEKVFKEFGVI